MNICSFPKCNNKILAKSLCGGHYRQVFDGKELTPLFQKRISVIDPSDPSTLLVPLTRGMTALVDICDKDLVDSKNWQAHVQQKNKTVYAYCKSGKLHRMIAQAMGLILLPGLEVDHIDTNGLNCRRSNLRIATGSQNVRNRSVQRNNSSGHKGVSWHKRIGKWYVKIQTEHKRVHLGYFHDLELAAFVYEEAAHKYHGEFARIK